MKVYITLLGRSTWSLINSLHVSLEEGNSPDLIHVFSEERFAGELKKIKKALEILSEGYEVPFGVETHMLDDMDFIEAAEKIREELKKYLKDESDVIIDITSGRKPLVTAAILSMEDLRGDDGLSVEGVEYLAIESLEDSSKPYFMIPLEIQHPKDLVKEVEKAKR